MRRIWQKKILGTCCIIGTAAKENLEDAKLHSETEFEKYRVLQDKIFMSDYNKFLSNNGQINFIYVCLILFV